MCIICHLIDDIRHHPVTTDRSMSDAVRSAMATTILHGAFVMLDCMDIHGLLYETSDFDPTEYKEVIVDMMEGISKRGLDAYLNEWDKDAERPTTH